MPYTFGAWDTVVRELQAERDRLATLRDTLGGIPEKDYRKYQTIRVVLSDLQRIWSEDK